MAKQLQVPVSDELMNALKELARQRGVTLTTLVNRALTHLTRARKAKEA